MLEQETKVATNSQLDITNSGYNGRMWAGHTQMAEYVFADGHVKALTSMQTLSSTDGGTAPLNYWTKDGYSFTDCASDNHCNNPNDVNAAKQILGTATTNYQ